MKKTLLLLLPALLASCGGGSSQSSSATPMKEKDIIGREIDIVNKDFKRIACIGAGALRLYSYVGDVSKLCAIEEIDNESLTTDTRPKMFDGVARPYVIANKEAFESITTTAGIGGPNKQEVETEKLVAAKPDLIISEYKDVEKADALAAATGATVMVVDYGVGGQLDIATFEESIRLLGVATGQKMRANELLDFYESEEAAISEATKNIAESSKKNVYISGLGNWGTTNQFMTTMNYRPFQIAGIKNVCTDLAFSGVGAITPEKFAALAPQMEVMIFDAAAVKNIRGKGFDFSACKAFETGEVYLQMAYNAYYINAETALINSWFCAKAAYPEVFKDLDIAKKADEITTKFNGKALYEQIKQKQHSFGGYQKIANPTEFFA